MAANTIRVKGLREMQKSLMQAEKAVRKEVRAAFREVGDIVKDDAISKFSAYDAGSASGFKVRVRQRGVAVEQSRRKTTGKRGDYGALMVTRALIPSFNENRAEVRDAFEDALDKVAHMVKGA